jgi:hypothetical protein
MLLLIHISSNSNIGCIISGNYDSITIPPMVYIWKCHQKQNTLWEFAITHTFGNTVTCKHNLGYRQLKTLGDAVSFSHLEYHQLHAFLDNILSGDQIPLHTKECVKNLRETQGLFIPPADSAYSD